MSVAKGKELNRAQLAKIFGVALTTVDAWIRRGCPVLSKGGRGVAHQFDSAAVFEWALHDVRRRP